MNLPKHEINSLVADMLPMLAPKSEIITYKKQTLTGLELILSGTKVTKSGKEIIASRTYPTKVPVMREVNHEEKIRKIIREAKTDLQVENDLGLYLAQNARSKEAITGEEDSEA